MNSDKNFKLAFVRFVYAELGYETEVGSDPFEDIAETFKRVPATHTDIGQTRWFNAGKLAFVSDSGLTESEYKRLDSNIESYLDKINESRETQLELRYYQYLSVLFTEIVLEKHSNDSLKEEFNKFIDEEFWQFEEDVLEIQDQFDKLAYWMATGSGKTYIMHINLLQVKNHFEDTEYDSLILIAPTEQVAQQHMGELADNGIKSSVLGYDKPRKDTVQVTDINKLQKGESGPKTVNVEDYGQKNIIFVDEGHKGLGSLTSTTSGWVGKRDYLVEDGGFAFEYSATFASSLDNASGYQEYSRAIVFDYPYGRFHKDGYGKDFNILNISSDDESKFVSEEQNKWLLSNLLSYYEKVRIVEEAEDVSDEYNIERPLSVFVGNSVNAITRGSSDVEDIVLFLSSVVHNENQWVTEVLNELLTNEGQFSDSGLFNDRFDYLRKRESNPNSLYNDLVNRVFKSESASDLELIRLKNLEDEELALSTNATDSYFGVITVGDTKKLFDRIEESDNNIRTIENEVYSSSLFDHIEDSNTGVDILIGSKKFAEGWDSTRPSTLGLLNLGRSEGPLVVQMFGRGVRVNGISADGKRSQKEVSQAKRYQVSRLETLDVFGVRADYIETFKEHLESERVSVDEEATVSVTVNQKDIKSETSTKLKVPKFVESENRDEMPTVELREVLNEGITEVLNLESDSSIKTPEITNQISGQRITKEGESDFESNLYTHSLQDLEINIGGRWMQVGLSVIDMDKVWNQVLEYKNQKGYSEIIITRESVEQLLVSKDYSIKAPKNFLRVQSKENLYRIEKVCEELVSQYIDDVYDHMLESVTYEKIKLCELDSDWLESNTPTEYELTIKNPDENEEIIEKIERDDKLGLDKYDEFEMYLFKQLRQLYYPVVVDSSALPDGQKQKYEEIITSLTPEGIDNEGERRFIEALEVHMESGALKDYETLVLRNQANSGISIPKVDGEFYPDFVIWAAKDGFQTIILADPHGLILGGKKSEFDAIERVNEKDTEDADVSINAFLFARSDADKSVEESRQEVAESNNMDVSDLEDNYIYFIGEQDADNTTTEREVGKMLSRVLRE